MFTAFLQKTALPIMSAVQLVIRREQHRIFNRGILRAKVRTYFPKPRENKRIKVHGYETRMSTPGGQRVIMRRILKGCHVLSH